MTSCHDAEVSGVAAMLAVTLALLAPLVSCGDSRPPTEGWPLDARSGDASQLQAPLLTGIYDVAVVETTGGCEPPISRLTRYDQWPPTKTFVISTSGEDSRVFVPDLRKGQFDTYRAYVGSGGRGTAEDFPTEHRPGLRIDGAEPYECEGDRNDPTTLKMSVESPSRNTLRVRLDYDWSGIEECLSTSRREAHIEVPNEACRESVVMRYTFDRECPADCRLRSSYESGHGAEDFPYETHPAVIDDDRDFCRCESR